MNNTITPMPLRRAGASGLYLSAVGMGLGRWGTAYADHASVSNDVDGFDLLDRALELGVTHWDTASGYGAGESEAIVGRYFSSRGAKAREAVVISTKWWSEQGLGRGGLRKAVDGCLRRLHTDYLDIFMMHNPCQDEQGNYLAPLEETWGAIDDLMTQGKILYPGISNAHGGNLHDAVAALTAVSSNASHRLTLVENNYSLLQRGQVGRGMFTQWRNGSTEEAFMHDLDTLGVGLIPFWPVCAGALTGRYRQANLADILPTIKDENFREQFLTGRTFAAIEVLACYAEEHNITLAQLAMAWLLSKKQVASVITGVTRREQLEENAGAAKINLTDAEIAEIDAIAAQAETVDEFCARYFGS